MRDPISDKEIAALAGVRRLRVETLALATSTNVLLKERARQGEAEGLVLIAGEQTAGHGRKGRPFFSPGDTGLYMSLLLRPKEGINALTLTTLCAVAVCEGLEDCLPLMPSIKWVNDIFAEGKKVCGILAEGATEGDRLRWVVLGLGVNVYPPEGGFPEALQSVAGAVCGSPEAGLRNRLAAAILRRFYARYDHPAPYMDEYRRRSWVPGHRVLVLRGEEATPALALSIDDEARLRVRYDDGREEALSSGEVSVRRDD